MNRQQKHPQLAVRNAAYREALQRLDEALERNSRSFTAETINLKLQQIRRRLFGVLPEDVNETHSAQKSE